MPEFVAEQYFARTDTAGARRAAWGARSAAEQLAREGTMVDLVRSVFVPEDETLLHIYAADSVETVRVAADRAGLKFERVAEAAGDL